MENEIIKKLDDLHQQIDAIYRKESLEAKDYVDVYDISFEALLLCNKMSEDELIPLLERIMFFYERIYEIKSVFEENAESVFDMDKIIEAVEHLEMGKKLFAQSKIGEKMTEGAVSPENLALFNSLAEFERQKSQIAPFLGICRIMCDIFASEDMKSEEKYQLYRHYHDTIARFLEEPDRGYSKRDWERMELAETKLIISEIEQKLIYGMNNPWNALLCYPYKKLLDHQKFLTEKP